MASKPNLTPTEDQEQERLVQWLTLHDIPHWRTPNETYTNSWKQKGKNKALGVKAGIPDLFILFRGKGLIAIEMKRVKGSVTSLAQKEWIKLLNEAEVPAHICYGADEAIDLVEQYCKQLNVVI